MSLRKEITAFLHSLKESSGALWLHEGRIRFSAPKEFQNEETDSFIRSNKDQIIEILSENGIDDSKKFLQRNIWRNNKITSCSLSSSQERLWFIEQYETGTNAYHLPGVFELEKQTNREALNKALRKIVSRHEILRSTIGFADEEGAIAQQTVNLHELQVGETIVRTIEEGETSMRADINRPFNLKEEYPIRVIFYKVITNDENEANRYFLLVNTHHIASDGWSLNIFQKELRTFYDAYANGRDDFELPPLDIQYKDYAIWQKTHFDGQELKRQLKFWSDRLSGFESLMLPLDYSRPAKIDYRGRKHTFSISKEIGDRLRAIAREQGATLYSVMLSSLSILLGKYGGQDDIVTGSPMANRHYKELKDLIGFFINTQVNRVKLYKDQSFRQLVGMVHNDQITSQSAQDLPFENLVEALDVDRDMSKHPVFQVMFSVQSFGHVDTSEDKDYLQVYKMKGAYEVEKFDLTILVDDSGDSLFVEVGYAESLFKEETIRRFSTHYLNLLKSITDEPEKPYMAISILDEEEKEKIINHWNVTEAFFPEKTIVELFQEQVEKVPHAIAVADGERSLTYQEFHLTTNRLAEHIRNTYKNRFAKDLQPDTPIAICAYRNIDMLIGIWGIMKAGAAYVPIESSYPEDRISYILEDTQAPLILAHREISPLIVSLPSEKVLYIDDAENWSAGESTSVAQNHARVRKLAYIIYTSGTTGKPKGVMIEHASLSQFIYNLREYLSDQLKVNLGDVLSLTNYVFDIFGLEYALALTTGHKVTLSTLEDVSSEQIKEHEIIQQTPSSLAHLAEKYSGVLSSKIGLVGGEALTASVAAKLSVAFSRLINLYGPTETTIWSTAHEVTDPTDITIGKPLLNEKIYILDSNKKSVPIGIPGEIYIGGESLSRGYYNRPELTGEKFVDYLVDEKKTTTERLYKTGDLARWRPDGTIAFIGRNDDQIKINGHRVELGEIEKNISQMEEIEQAVVLAKHLSVGKVEQHYLVAYYTSKKPIEQETAQQYLSALLPSYMIPAYWMRLDTFPLTVNGKLDRKALPDPKPETTQTFVAPQNAMEKEICKIWQEVIGVDQVGVTDDFFGIGGTSILAIQAANKMEQVLRNTVKVADIFRLKNIDQILKNHSDSFSLLHYYQEPDETLQDIIFIHPGGGGVEVYQDLANDLKDKYNCIGIDNYNIHHREQINSLENLAQYYLRVYAESRPIGKKVMLIGWSLGGTIALEMAAILEKRGIENISVFVLDTLIHDDYMRSFINREYVRAAMKRAQEEASNQGLFMDGAAYVAKVNLALESEVEIMRSKITKRLTDATVVVFKAMKVELFDVLEDANAKNTHIRALNYNNVDLFADNVRTIRLDCHHNDILLNGRDEISKTLLADVKDTTGAILPSH
ncbi:MAG: amino acid adenylation domain-containing protein [Cyclobacteriaceae bacterium]